MARRAKPIDLIVLEGKSHKTKEEIERRRSQEITPPSDNIEAPNWLDEVAEREWERIQDDLIELGLLTNIDVNQLAIYCDAYSKYVKATTEINKYGLVIKHTNKAGATNIVTNPYVQIANKYAELIKKFCDEFGLTPSSRARIAIPKQEEKQITPEERRFGDV